MATRVRKRNSGGESVVLVGTYRSENLSWIVSKRLYNLPFPEGGDVSAYAKFTHVVLYAADAEPLAFTAKTLRVVGREDLKGVGYALAKMPHAARYVLFELGEKACAANVLANPAAEVWVCSSRWTGVVDANFYDKPLPACGGKSIPNVFERLRPYFGMWKSAKAFNPVQMDFFRDLMQLNCPFPPPKKPKFTFVDLFAGIGGFHQAMQKLGGKCVFACEWDKDAQSTYAENYGISPAGDITKVDERAIPRHDVLCAGFPCQAFSKAGKQLGFADETKGTLFFDVERILKYHRTKYVILENVRNLVSHDHGNTWKTIREHLLRLGYRLTPEPLIVSPHQFGIPQLRERVVVLCVYDPPNANKPLEINLPKPHSKKDCSLETVFETDNRDSAYDLTEQEIEVIDAWDEFHKGIHEKTIGFPVWADWFKVPPPPPDKMPEWKRAFIVKNNALYRKNKVFIDGWLRRHDNLRSFTPTMRKMEWQCGTAVDSAWDAFLQMRPSGLRIKRPDCAPALVAIVQIPIIGPLRRRMTVREAARLQSFDDRFIPNRNRHQAYKQFGNAVNVDVIRQCAERLFQVVAKT